MFTQNEIETMGLALLTRIDHLHDRIEKYGPTAQGINWAEKLVKTEALYGKFNEMRSDLVVH